MRSQLASPRLASPRLASPRLASPRLASPRLASPRLASPGSELERQALEALVLEKFAAGLLDKDELGQVLGLGGRDEVDGFLKARDVFEPCTADDVERDVATLVRHGPSARA